MFRLIVFIIFLMTVNAFSQNNGTGSDLNQIQILSWNIQMLNFEIQSLIQELHF